MKIFIAGGAGYIGSRIVPRLIEEGHDITVLDLLWFGNNLDKNVKVIQKDIFDIDSSLLRGFDQVIFLAGLSNDPMAEYSPAMNFIANAAAPAYLAYISKNAGIKRFIYADSCSVYGYTDNKISTEESAVKSLYPYGISKLQGGLAAMQLADNNFSVICLRQGTVSGYSPRVRFDLIINTMYMKAATERKITVNNPAIWRPILAISDAVNAYTKAVQADYKISGVFNVCSGNFTVGEVGEKVSEYFKKNYGVNIPLEIKNISDFRNYKVSNQKAKEILGINFCGSIESILDELNACIGRDFDFQNDKHYNIKVFKKRFNNNKHL